MSSDDDLDYSEIQSALGSIGLSAALIFGATLLSQSLGFLTRVIMARYLPVDGYGNVVIGISILNLFGIAALLGMPDALSRYLPRQETADERRTILVPTFQITIVVSVLLALGIYVTASAIATVIFRNANLIWMVRTFASILPFYVLMNVCFGGFRGYEKTYPRILTQNVLRPVLQLAGIILFVTFGYGSLGIAFAYGAAFVAAAIIGLLLLYRMSEIKLNHLLQRQKISHYQALLSFSVPLAASGAVNMIAKHSDLVLLGIFKSSTSVGIYEVSFRSAMFLTTIFLPAIGYLFQPIISRFDAQNNWEKMDNLYTVSTRWIVVSSFPIFALFFLFPEQTLTFFFGEQYQAGQATLQILLVGFMIALIPGLTGSVLTAVGETKVLFYISVITMVLNVVVNMALIPIFGLLGAAIATATARIVNNILQLYYIKRNLKIHPFNRSYLVPSSLMLVTFVLIIILPLPFNQLSFLGGFVVATGLGILYLGFILATHSVLSVELKLIDQLFERLRIPVSASDTLQRFVR